MYMSKPALKISRQRDNQGGGSVVSDTKTKGVKFTQAQIEALDELAERGIFKPFGATKKDDPDIVYQYNDFSAMVRALLAQVYEDETGKKFPPDPVRGNPNF